MNWVSPLLDLREDCENAVASVTALLTSSGLRVVRSFDLQSACASHSSRVCPHHGQRDCDCQLVVLMIYGSQEQPGSLVLHSSDGQTRVGLAAMPDQTDAPKLEKRIRAALGLLKSVESILE